MVEDDEELERIAFLVATTHHSLDEITRMSALKQLFLVYAVQKEEKRKDDLFWERMGRQLGTLWYRSDFANPERNSAATRQDSVSVPLAVLLSHTNIQKNFKEYFDGEQKVGDYLLKDGEISVDLGKLSYAEYRKAMEKMGR